MVKKLVLIRHGFSEWNEKNLFTGWVDVKLSEKGRAEAENAGKLLADSGIKPDILYTSRLTRAIQTANIALERADRLWIDVERSWRLNERHYGDLQGKDKAVALQTFGPELFKTYRRSYDVPPPEIRNDSEFSQFHDERYRDLDPAALPKTESLKLVIDRLLPFWQDKIAPSLLDDKIVLVVAHGNSLRGLYKYLTNTPENVITEFNIPTGIPLIFELDDNLKPIKEPYYLDPEAAAAGAAAVAAQGQKK